MYTLNINVSVRIESNIINLWFNETWNSCLQIASAIMNKHFRAWYDPLLSRLYKHHVDYPLFWHYYKSFIFRSFYTFGHFKPSTPTPFVAKKMQNQKTKYDIMIFYYLPTFAWISWQDVGKYTDIPYMNPMVNGKTNPSSSKKYPPDSIDRRFCYHSTHIKDHYLKCHRFFYCWWLGNPAFTSWGW